MKSAIMAITGIALLAALGVMTFLFFDERSSNEDLEVEVARMRAIAQLTMHEYYVSPNGAGLGMFSNWQEDPYFVRLSAALTDPSMMDFKVSPDGTNAMIKMPVRPEDLPFWAMDKPELENVPAAQFFQVTTRSKVWAANVSFDRAENPISFKSLIPDIVDEAIR